MEKVSELAHAILNIVPRGKAAKEFHDPEYEKWKEKHDYGKRPSVEESFSTANHCFGETVRTASREGMIREVKRKYFTIFDEAKNESEIISRL